LFKEFAISDISGRNTFSVILSLYAGYYFSNKFKGTSIIPESKYLVIPEADFKWSHNNFIFYTGLEYMNSGFHRISPFWCKIGLSYNFFFDNIRSNGKTIRWY
jgi:hypothetical protein